MNISSALFQGTKILKSNSIITAEIDAEILMAKAINKDRKYILLNSTQKVDTEALNIYEKLIENPDVLYGANIGSSYSTQNLALSKHFHKKNP